MGQEYMYDLNHFIFIEIWDLFYGPEYGLLWLSVLCAFENNFYSAWLDAVFPKDQLGTVDW